MESSAGDSANNMDDDATNQGNLNHCRSFDILVPVIIFHYGRKNQLSKNQSIYCHLSTVWKWKINFWLTMSEIGQSDIELLFFQVTSVEFAGVRLPKIDLYFILVFVLVQ